MATSSKTTERRSQYRIDAQRLIACARAAAELLDVYSWHDSDGAINYTTEPNPLAAINPYEFGNEVRARWGGLRAALVVAGVVGAEGTPGRLPGGLAVFLRVQSFDLPTATPGVVAWRTRALFEVLTGVNSYGYADGAALDAYYELRKAVTVRMLRQTLAIADVADYLNGDQHGVTVESVIGQIEPFNVPDFADGWAIIGDFVGNPEPDFFGLETRSVIVIKTGMVGPVGPQGPPGVGGGDGGGGGGGGVVTSPVWSVGVPNKNDVFAVMQPLQIYSYSRRFIRLFRFLPYKMAGGVSSVEGNTKAIAAFRAATEGLVWDQSLPYPISTALGQPLGSQWLVNLKTGLTLDIWQEDGVRQSPPFARFVSTFVIGDFIDGTQPDGLIFAEPGEQGLSGQPWEVLDRNSSNYKLRQPPSMEEVVITYAGGDGIRGVGDIKRWSGLPT